MSETHCREASVSPVAGGSRTGRVMKVGVRTLLVLLWLLVFLVTSPSSRAGPSPGSGPPDWSGTTNDPDDVAGPIDVLSVWHAHSADTVTYSVTTYEPFPTSAVSQWLWSLDFGDSASGGVDACVAVTAADGALRAGLQRGPCVTDMPSNAAVDHVDGSSTLILTVPLRALRDAGLSGDSYRYVLAAQVANPDCPVRGVGCDGSEDFVGPVTQLLTTAAPSQPGSGITPTPPAASAAPSTGTVAASSKGATRAIVASTTGVAGRPAISGQPAVPVPGGGATAQAPSCAELGMNAPDALLCESQGGISGAAGTAGAQASTQSSGSARAIRNEETRGGSAGRSAMASTGSNIGLLLAVAGASLAVGFLLVRRSRRSTLVTAGEGHLSLPDEALQSSPATDGGIVDYGPLPPRSDQRLLLGAVGAVGATIAVGVVLAGWSRRR